MATPTTPITLVGATGLTGSSTLLHLLQSKRNFDITAITRKQLANPISTSTSKYANLHYPDLTSSLSGPVGKKDGVYISCLGSTRAGEGGLEGQIKIDLDLNRDLAKKAKDDGADTIILVSTGMADSSSRFGYTKMKGQLEDEVKSIGFKRTIILQPGLLMGSRSELRVPEKSLQLFFGALRTVGIPTTYFAIDAEDVGAGIAQIAANPPDGVTIMNDHEIVKYAKAFRQAQLA